MKCPKCNCQMNIGTAIDPERDGCAIYVIDPPPIAADRVKLIDVYKCPECGHSESIDYEDWIVMQEMTAPTGQIFKLRVSVSGENNE